MNINTPISLQNGIECESNDLVIARWLVILGLYLTILIEVFPIEADILFAIVRSSRNVPVYIGTKAAFLSVILLPLLIFFRINGSAAYKAVRTRLTIIGMIVGLNLLGNIAVLMKFYSS